MEQKQFPQRGHKPANNHPWKNSRLIDREKGEWIREHTTDYHVNSWKVTGGKPQK